MGRNRERRGKRAWNRAKKRRAVLHSSLVKGLRAKMDPVKQQARHVSWSHRRTQRYTANKIMREWLNSILRNPLVPIHFASPDASNNICNDDPYISLDGNVYCIHARHVSLPNNSFDSRIKKRGNRREESRPIPFRGTRRFAAWEMKRDYSFSVRTSETIRRTFSTIIKREQSRKKNQRL